MLKKILKILGKLHILKIGSYHVKGTANDVIDADTSSHFSSSWFYGEIEEKIDGKKHKKDKKHKKEKWDTWKEKVSYTVKQKLFVGIGIVLLIFVLWYLIDTLSAWPEWWSGGDFVIIVFLLLWSFLFLPFSYTWQEKHRWKSIIQINMWLFIVYAILSFGIENILFDIFMWDSLNFSFWRILYVLLIVFLRSLFLPRSILRWKKKYKTFNILQRRYSIFWLFILIWVVSLLMDTGWSDNTKLVETDDGSYVIKKVCLWSDQTPVGDERLTKTSFVAYDHEDVPFYEIQQDTFQQGKLANIWFYIEGKVQEDNSIWWSNWEICDLATNTVSVSGDIVEYRSDIFPATIGNEGHIDQFSLSRGEYAFNIFTSSHDTWPWKLAKQIPFTIK